MTEHNENYWHYQFLGLKTKLADERALNQSTIAEWKRCEEKVRDLEQIIDERDEVEAMLRKDRDRLIKDVVRMKTEIDLLRGQLHERMG